MNEDEIKRELIHQIRDAKELGMDGWEKVKELQLKVLEIDPTDVRSLLDLAIIAKRQEDMKGLKKWQSKILELEPDNVISMSELIRVAQRERNWAEVKRLASRILELEPDNVRAKNVLKDAEKKERAAERKAAERGSIQPGDSDRSEFFFEERAFIESRRIAELRHQLYSENLPIEQLSKLSEELKDTLEGRLFIAEMCNYYDQPKLALQALKGYQKEHQEDISEKEVKVIKQAFEIIRAKKRIKNNHKWLEVYSRRTGEER